jgi:hypothetical protein
VLFRIAQGWFQANLLQMNATVGGLVTRKPTVGHKRKRAAVSDVQIGVNSHDQADGRVGAGRSKAAK